MRQEKRKEPTESDYFFVNCIVNKVQEFMYKKTVAVTSAPQRETENRRKAPGCGLEKRWNKQQHTQHSGEC